MLGRKKDADEAYREAAELSRDVSPSTWGKALAARKLLTDEEVSELETALRYLELLHGASFVLRGAWLGYIRVSSCRVPGDLQMSMSNHLPFDIFAGSQRS